MPIGYNVDCLLFGAALGRLNAMTARRSDFFAYPAAFRSPPSLLRNRSLLPSPLESALLQVLIVDDLKSFRMNIYEKPGGRGAPPMAFCYSLLNMCEQLRRSVRAF